MPTTPDPRAPQTQLCETCSQSIRWMTTATGGFWAHNGAPYVPSEGNHPIPNPEPVR